jgi:hypothetical protein
MKKVILGMMVVLALAACNPFSTEKVESTDSTSVAADTTLVVVDSVKVDTLSK